MSAARPANSHDVIILGAGAAGLMCAGVAGQARPLGAGAGTGAASRRENPHLRRRAMQFHQSAHVACEFSVRQSAVLPFGAERIHPARLHRAGRDNTASPGTRRRAGNCSAMARRGRSSTCCWRNAEARNCASAFASRRSRKAKTALSLQPIKANFAAARWWSPPAARRFRKWARADSATGSPSSSASRSCRRARRWCR